MGHDRHGIYFYSYVCATSFCVTRISQLLFKYIGSLGGRVLGNGTAALGRRKVSSLIYQASKLTPNIAS